ncbi:MAG: hypothetical protein WC222_05285 [Parachlamydiales bacterium]
MNIISNIPNIILYPLNHNLKELANPLTLLFYDYVFSPIVNNCIGLLPNKTDFENIPLIKLEMKLGLFVADPWSHRLTIKEIKLLIHALQNVSLEKGNAHEIRIHELLIKQKLIYNNLPTVFFKHFTVAVNALQEDPDNYLAYYRDCARENHTYFAELLAYPAELPMPPTMTSQEYTRINCLCKDVQSDKDLQDHLGRLSILIKTFKGDNAFENDYLLSGSKFVSTDLIFANSKNFQHLKDFLKLYKSYGSFENLFKAVLEDRLSLTEWLEVLKYADSFADHLNPPANLPEELCFLLLTIQKAKEKFVPDIFFDLTHKQLEKLDDILKLDLTKNIWDLFQNEKIRNLFFKLDLSFEQIDDLTKFGNQNTPAILLPLRQNKTRAHLKYTLEMSKILFAECSHSYSPQFLNTIFKLLGEHKSFSTLCKKLKANELSLTGGDLHSLIAYRLMLNFPQAKMINGKKSTCKSKKTAKFLQFLEQFKIPHLANFTAAQLDLYMKLDKIDFNRPAQEILNDLDLHQLLYEMKEVLPKELFQKISLPIFENLRVETHIDKINAMALFINRSDLPENFLQSYETLIFKANLLLVRFNDETMGEIPPEQKLTRDEFKLLRDCDNVFFLFDEKTNQLLQKVRDSIAKNSLGPETTHFCIVTTNPASWVSSVLPYVHTFFKFNPYKTQYPRANYRSWRGFVQGEQEIKNIRVLKTEEYKIRPWVLFPHLNNEENMGVKKEFKLRFRDKLILNMYQKLDEDRNYVFLADDPNLYKKILLSLIVTIKKFASQWMSYLPFQSNVPLTELNYSTSMLCHHYPMISIIKATEEVCKDMNLQLPTNTLADFGFPNMQALHISSYRIMTVWKKMGLLKNVIKPEKGIYPLEMFLQD